MNQRDRELIDNVFSISSDFDLCWENNNNNINIY